MIVITGSITYCRCQTFPNTEGVLITYHHCKHFLIINNKNPDYDISVFHTGEEAIAELHQEPDVVILDYQLNTVVPDAQDGVHILQAIKKIDKDTTVIMLSSQDNYNKALQTIIKGALEYVVKDDNAFVRIDKILSELS